ncbi:MAG: hypothetical protein GY714_17600 [Desulfobacterales bacterium]|nr:hypothetical protein [Desulfobacterales bacterium]MCP4162885.1 hypothetical protein [Deltaproteobacteria bacterium]
MYKNYFNSIKYSIPLTIILFATVTMRTEVSFIDGPSFNYYGFPFTYLRWCGFSSIEYNLDIINFFLNSIIYFTFCTFIVSLKAILNILEQKRILSLIVLITLSLYPLFFIYVELFFMGEYYRTVSINLDGGDIVARFWHFGFDRPY